MWRKKTRKFIRSNDFCRNERLSREIHTRWSLSSNVSRAKMCGSSRKRTRLEMGTPMKREQIILGTSHTLWRQHTYTYTHIHEHARIFMKFCISIHTHVFVDRRTFLDRRNEDFRGCLHYNSILMLSLLTSSFDSLNWNVSRKRTRISQSNSFSPLVMNVLVRVHGLSFLSRSRNAAQLPAWMNHSRTRH